MMLPDEQRTTPLTLRRRAALDLVEELLRVRADLHGRLGGDVLCLFVVGVGEKLAREAAQFSQKNERP
jgi:hypothetical protein